MTTTNYLFDDMTNIIADHLYVGQSLQFKTDSIQVEFVRNNMSNMSTSINMQDAQINVVSYCDMLLNANCSNRILTQRVTLFSKFRYLLRNIILIIL